MEKNQYECPRCKEILTSKHNYDMQKCDCGALAIDGGENLRVIELDAAAFCDENSKNMNNISKNDNIAYFKRHQEKGIFNYYKVVGGRGKTKDGYQQVINFLNEKPLIYLEHNNPFDPKKPKAPFRLTGTWDTYEVGTPISKEEYELAYSRATSNNFKKDEQ